MYSGLIGLKSMCCLTNQSETRTPEMACNKVLTFYRPRRWRSGLSVLLCHHHQVVGSNLAGGMSLLESLGHADLDRLKLYLVFRCLVCSGTMRCTIVNKRVGLMDRKDLLYHWPIALQPTRSLKLWAYSSMRDGATNVSRNPPPGEENCPLQSAK
jgi:hypothetical protein